MSKKFNVAIAGATGPVGQAMLDVLAERKFPVKNVFALEAADEAGDTVFFGTRELVVGDIAEFDFASADLVLFAPEAGLSQPYAERAVRAGCRVVDASSAFHQDPAVPLVVPEANPAAVAGQALVASPAAVAVPLLVALKPLHDAVGIVRADVTALLAVSGDGRPAIDELASQTMALFNQQDMETAVYPQRIAFNLLPQAGAMNASGHAGEELALVEQTRRILSGDVAISASCVRVPLFFGHAFTVHLETRDVLDPARARALLATAPGIQLKDDAVSGGWATPMEAAGQDAVLVSRIRESLSGGQGIDLWIVADNIRKGMATNAVQIAELLAGQAD